MSELGKDYRTFDIITWHQCYVLSCNINEEKKKRIGRGIERDIALSGTT